MRPERLLVLGGTRSGKSRYAVERAREIGTDAVTFIATARRGDPEFDERIQRHRRERPPEWSTSEVGADLPSGIVRAERSHVVLVDSLTLWVATLLDRAGDMAEHRDQLARAIASRARPVILVSDEVGLATVPATALGRRFVDELGDVNRLVASLCGEVRLVIAGIPLTVRSRS